ncbi:alpha/beta fold hydrolase [Mycolicibacterium palauense]|uniref:alpha/beta fold hydrolase n=1 Tax=Mycolicibacterium palauense TaxID=2034511 RepID=UPI000BFF0310|nr:alpha/beta fold hydrolase [Mycolicibacterium palauense]
MSEPQFITVAGRPARVRLDGDPANPPVLLLHGITRSLEDWSAQVTRLSQRYRVIAPDLPGFGYSARKPGPATPLALADGVAETLDALAETRACHVIGNSLGGTVAMQLLAAHPDRVGSLVLVNSAGFGSSVTPLLRLLTVPGVGRYVATHTTAAGARLMERQIFADPALATTERIEHALALGARPGNGAFVHELANVLGTPRGVRAPWRRTLLGAVTRHPRPTMIMWGDRDRILPARHFDAARTHFPHARTHMFAGVGHMPQIERPDEFARLVLPFLADATAPADTGTAGSV